jgi:hypothetical protein
MPDHVAASEIEEFVIGALTEDRRARFEEHVASCDECGERLAREARLELALVEVAAAAPRRRRSLAARTAWAAPIAVVAVVIAFTLRDDHRGVAGGGRARVVCADGPDQLACVEDAERHGLFVQYPDWAGAPPLGDPDPASGPSTAPFEGAP